MTYKEFGEEADIRVEVKILVNDEVAFSGSDYSINGAIAELGKAERMNAIDKELQKQYENLPEPIEDEARGLVI